MALGLDSQPFVNSPCTQHGVLMSTRRRCLSNLSLTSLVQLVQFISVYVCTVQLTQVVQLISSYKLTWASDAYSQNFLSRVVFEQGKGMGALFIYIL